MEEFLETLLTRQRLLWYRDYMKKIFVSPDYVAWVDDEDYATLSAFKWYHVKNRTTVYAYTRMHGKQTPMHTLLVPNSDHINHDGLDNQKHNLRPATQSQNRMNSRKLSTITSSKYKGVCWHKKAQKWMAHIKVNRKPRYLGLFIQEWDAAEAYNDAATKLFGAFAHLNILEAL